MASKLAIVTGANTKAGWLIVKDLLFQNFTVIGLSSSLQRIECLKTQLRRKYHDVFHARECDFNSLDAIKTTMLWIWQRFPAIAEISIHSHQKNDIDKFIYVSKTLVGCRTLWRQTDIIGSAEMENAENFLIEIQKNKDNFI